MKQTDRVILNPPEPSDEEISGVIGSISQSLSECQSNDNSETLAEIKKVNGVLAEIQLRLGVWEERFRRSHQKVRREITDLRKGQKTLSTTFLLAAPIVIAAYSVFFMWEQTEMQRMAAVAEQTRTESAENAREYQKADKEHTRELAALRSEMDKRLREQDERHRKEIERIKAVPTQPSYIFIVVPSTEPVVPVVPRSSDLADDTNP